MQERTKMNRLPLIWALSAGVAMTAVSAGGSAWAQDAGAEADERETIIVTAQRREQSLQDVPIAVNVFTGDVLDTLGAEDIAEIEIFTPGLSIDDLDITQPTFTIRGVNTSDFGIGTEPSVGLFVDGVYSARSGAGLVFFQDVERVEVLKGPQGTLFGRNTSAGALSIITRKPSDEFELSGKVRFGNFDKRRFEGTVNVPLTDSLAVRVNGLWNTRDGYLEDAITGEDYEREGNWAFRVSLGWQPTDATEVILRWEHDELRKDGPAAVGISPFSLSQRFDGPFANDALLSHETRTLNGYSLSVTHDFDFAQLVSISAFKSFDTNNREDEDGTNLIERYFDTENIEENESWYQELKLIGETGPVSWIAGVSYFREDAEQMSATTAFTDSIDVTLGNLADFPIFTILNSVGLPVFGGRWVEDISGFADNESYAAFADATWAVTDRLNLTAGLRYTRDEKQFTWFNGPREVPLLDEVAAPGSLYNAILGAPLFPDDPIPVNVFFDAVIGGDVVFNFGAFEGVPFTREETFDDLSPRFVVDYKLTDDVLLFASASRGYKAGGFNSVELNSFFDDESVWNFEGGVKSEWFGGALRVNASAYYFEYKDRQQISLEGTNNSGVPQFVTVTGNSEAWGIDLDSQWSPTDNLSFTLAAGYIDSTWVDRIERGVDISGQPTGEPYARIVIGVDYEHPLPEGYGTLLFHADNSFTTEQRQNDANELADAGLIALGVGRGLLDELDGSRNFTNARLTWLDHSDRYSVSVYVENLFDNQVPRGFNDITAASLGTPYVRVDEPRYYGVDFGFQY